jgi:hypothetical protein
MKFWKINDSRRNQLIVIKDQTIYKGTPKTENLARLQEDTVPDAVLNGLFSIPYSYIKEIHNQKGKNEIKIYFGNDSEEELYITDRHIKSEVFEYLKQELTNFTYSAQVPSVFKYAKAPLFALLFTTGIFIWSLYLALQIESGVEYELVGGGRPGITGIVLAIAHLGSLKISLVYATLLAIMLFSLSQKLKSRSETQYLKR